MQKLISGHLNLLRALVTCEGVNKHDCGPKLVNQVLDYFLFPASNLMAEAVEPLARRLVEISPRCEEVESQVSAYRLLTVLAVGSVENMNVLSQRLIQLHLTEKPEMAKEWEVGISTLYNSVYLSIPLYNSVYLCIPLYSHVYIPLYNSLYLGIPLYCSVYRCIPLYNSVYSCNLAEGVVQLAWGAVKDCLHITLLYSPLSLSSSIHLSSVVHSAGLWVCVMQEQPAT